jgi:hypothetical protein
MEPNNPLKWNVVQRRMLFMDKSDRPLQLTFQPVTPNSAGKPPTVDDKIRDRRGNLFS